MRFNEAIEKALQELINSKHLYQPVTVDFEPCVRGEAREVFLRGQRADLPGSRESEDTVKQGLLKDLDAKDWYIGTDLKKIHPFYFSLPPLRLLCTVCHDVEPFNLLGEESLRQGISMGRPGEQVFWLPLQCQSCRYEVLVLLVRRIGRKITLVGRSEFEEVKVPQYIPKAQRGFYSQAVIAFQSNQVLAALFLLRTLVEQHMRAATGSNELRGDELCEKYASKLDKDLNSKFPSLRVVYGNLSDALHRADSDEALFGSELKNVCFHFEAKELFDRTNRPKT
jgi:hypothetical protein